MQPVLILTETEKINAYKEFLPTTLPPLQAFYDLFKAIDIEPTLQDMTRLAFYDNSTQVKSQIDDYVGDKMIEKAGTPDFGGIPIKRSKLREMLDMPTTVNLIKQSEVVKTASNYNYQYWLEIKYLEIVNHKVAIKASAFADIEVRYTHYTQNDRGAVLTTKMNTIIPSLNELITVLGGNLASGNYMRDFELDKIGIEYAEGKLRPDLNFIRRQEGNYPNYVAS